VVMVRLRLCLINLKRGVSGQKVFWANHRLGNSHKSKNDNISVNKLQPTCMNVADEAAAATFVAGMDDSAGGVDVFQGFFGSTGVAVVDGDTGGFSKLSCRLMLMEHKLFYRRH